MPPSHYLRAAFFTADPTKGVHREEVRFKPFCANDLCMDPGLHIFLGTDEEWEIDENGLREALEEYTQLEKENPALAKA